MYEQRAVKMEPPEEKVSVNRVSRHKSSKHRPKKFRQSNKFEEKCFECGQSDHMRTDP